MKEKLDALYITKLVPSAPALAGDTIYSKGILESIREHLSVTVLAARCDPEQAIPSEFGRLIVTQAPRENRWGSVFSLLPLISWKGWSKEHRDALNSLLDTEWDIIILDNIGSFHSLARVLKYKATRNHTKIVYISHEMEFLTRRAKYKAYSLGTLGKIAATWDLMKVRAAESQLIQKPDLVTAIAKSDFDLISSMRLGRNTLLITPGYDGNIVATRTITQATPKKVLVLGGRQSKQKIDILLSWLERSYELFTENNIEMVVAGHMDVSDELRISNRYPSIELRGYVDDLSSIADDVRIGVIPDDLGGGFKLRILSQVFHRIPTFGLEGSFNDLPAEGRPPYCTADSMADLAAMCVQHIDNLEYLNELQSRAFASCIDQYQWSSRGAKIVRELTRLDGK